MNLVLDTNIIVSALLSPDGSAFHLLSDVFDNKHTVFIDPEVYREYQDVLHREKFGFDEEIVTYILEWFKIHAIWVEVTKSTVPMPDEKDRAFYDIAKCCHAKLVTGNIRHYPVDEFVTPLRELDSH
ncbi:MAG: putative toxin-antitoxin system toxin component, PIN family [Bacteroidales bacterium]|nr:putative toxin-antitoxin system toxin component, PIN family [Bacteroidales bacterium]MCM1416783.1 putative toxin-antitoxin system toxin component, PIN family [bacterium]